MNTKVKKVITELFNRNDNIKEALTDILIK